MHEKDEAEDDSEQIKLGKRRYSKNVKSLNMTVSSNDEDLRNVIKTPLAREDIVTEISGLQEGSNYLVVYTDSIDGLNEEVRLTGQQLPTDFVPIAKTFQKVFKGKDEVSKTVFCSYSDCLRFFNVSGNLNIHLRTHTGQRPFVCTHPGCAKRFITKCHLDTHIRIHTGEKPFKCMVCGKDYQRQERLAIHERTHSGIKPFECNLCGKRFTENGNLKTHIKRHQLKLRQENPENAVDEEEVFVQNKRAKIEKAVEVKTPI